MNGDGLNDRVVTYANPLDLTGWPRAWHLLAFLGNGRSVSSDLPHGKGDSEARRMYGLADADADGRDEAFVILDEGASTSFLGIFDLAGGRLHRVRISGEADHLVGVGGVALSGGGAQCEQNPHDGAHQFVITSYSVNRDQTLMRLEDKAYEWQGHSLVLVDTTTRRRPYEGNTVPPLRYRSFSCDPLFHEF